MSAAQRQKTPGNTEGGPPPPAEADSEKITYRVFEAVMRELENQDLKVEERQYSETMRAEVQKIAEEKTEWRKHYMKKRVEETKETEGRKKDKIKKNEKEKKHKMDEDALASEVSPTKAMDAEDEDKESSED